MGIGSTMGGLGEHHRLMLGALWAVLWVDVRGP